MESSKVCAKFGGAATALTALGRRKRANLRIIASLPVALACHGASFGCRSAVESCRQSPLQIVRFLFVGLSDCTIVTCRCTRSCRHPWSKFEIKLFLHRAFSSEGSNGSVPIRTVPIQVAHELLNAGHRYLDVRTAEEFASGHIEGAVNVPYMLKAGIGLTKNLKFLEEVSEKFGKDDEVVVGCQMGKRSKMATEELVNAGYTGITDMAGGYAAWVKSGMPVKSNA